MANFLWDRVLPKEKAAPASGHRRNPFTRRMRCSNWRFALYLLIISGFWTSYGQLFLSLPEYLRDFADTRPLVNAGRSIFGRLGKPQWIDSLAVIEQSELLAHFDRLLRRARGYAPLTEPHETPNGEHEPISRNRRLDRLANDPGLAARDVEELGRLLPQVNAPEANLPLDELDLVEGARQMLGYKVRMRPSVLATLLAAIPHTPQPLDDKLLDGAVRALNRRLELQGRRAFDEAERPQLRSALRALLEAHGPVVPRRESVTVAAELSSEQRELAVGDLAVAINHLAYRRLIWDEVDAGRQVNPEHIVNIVALSIVLLQVLVSYLTGRLQRLTAMIVGMLVCAVGMTLWGAADGTMIGAVGGLIAVIVVGIVIFGIGEMMASPTSQEYVGRVAPKDRVALYMGYYFVSMALGNLFGGILSGQMYGKLARDMQRPDLMWFGFAGLMVLTAFTLLLYNCLAVPRRASAD